MRPPVLTRLSKRTCKGLMLLRSKHATLNRVNGEWNHCPSECFLHPTVISDDRHLSDERTAEMPLKPETYGCLLKTRLMWVELFGCNTGT